MSRFVDKLVATAVRRQRRGVITGEPGDPVRTTWARVHEQARAVAGGLVSHGLARGDAVAVLAAEPAAIGPAVQAVWLAGGSVTMLHQPTPRSDLALWAEDTVRVLNMIGSKLVLLGEPFDQLGPVLDEHGIGYRLITELAGRSAAGVVRRGRRGSARAAAADQRLDGRPEGRADHPRQPAREHLGHGATGRARPRERHHGVVAADVPRHGHGRLLHDADGVRHRAGQGHAGGLPDRAAAVGEADPQYRRHDHRRAELRVRAAGPPACPAWTTTTSTTCRRCGSR